MPNKIQFKRGASAPGTILAQGEPGYDTTNNVFYIGNGEGSTPTAFNLGQIVKYLSLQESGKLKVTYGDNTTDNPHYDAIELLNGSVAEDENRGVKGSTIYSAINSSISASAEVYVGTDTPATTYKVWLKSSGSNIVIYANNGGSWVEVAAISGVYVGSGDMPSGYNVQVDPTGEAVEVATKAELDALAARVTALGG